MLPRIFADTRILLDFTAAELDPNDPQKIRSINLTTQCQQFSLWCWTATTSSVSKFYNPKSQWTQCVLFKASSLKHGNMIDGVCCMPKSCMVFGDSQCD